MGIILAKVDAFVPNPTYYKVAIRGGQTMSKHLMYSDVEQNNNKVYASRLSLVLHNLAA